MRTALFLLLVLCFAFAPVPLFAAAADSADSGGVPGIDPLPSRQVSMTQDQLEAFFAGLKKGAPVQLTFDRGRVVKGVFSSYDDYYQTVWIVPRQGEKGFFNQKGYKLGGIQQAAPWDVRESQAQKPVEGFAAFADGSSTTDEYILTKPEAK